MTEWHKELLANGNNSTVGQTDHSESLSDPLDQTAIETERNF